MSYIGVQPTAGQYRQLDDISGSFNGATVTFTTSVGGLNVTAGSAEQLLVSLGGVIQNPGADYSVSTNSITFTTAPGSGLDFFAILMGDAVNVGTPADGSVTSVKLASDLTVDLASGTVSAPSLTFDANTGLYSPGADQVAVATNGVERVEFGTSEVVFNDGGEDIDFRIEGDTEANLLFVDAGNERIGIGTASPAERLDIEASVSGGTVAAKIENTANASSDIAELQLVTGSENWKIKSLWNGGSLTFNKGTGEVGRFDSSGRLLVGTSTARANFFNSTESTKLQVEGTATSDSSISLVRNSNNTGYPFIAFGKTRGTAVGATTIVQSGDSVGGLEFMGSDGTEFVPAGSIRCEVDGTPGANDMPGRIIFSTTADGASSPTERMRITQTGDIFAQRIYDNTTANAANVWVSSSGGLNRSTSSGKYKTDIETLELSYSEKLLGCRPVWYRSLCKLDNPNWGYWGFIAEEVAEIDPRLVHWKTTEPVVQDDGSLEHVPCEPEPEGVAYDRFVPHLLNLIKRQQQAIEELQTEVAALKAQ